MFRMLRPLACAGLMACAAQDSVVSSPEAPAGDASGPLQPSAAPVAGSAAPVGPTATMATSPAVDPPESEDDRDLGLPPPQAGFKRYYSPAEPVPAGDSKDFIQWIDGPLDQDYDVVAVSGKQGVGGHHAMVYAFPEVQEIGFSREFTVEDQVSTSLLGSASVDGSIGIELPDNVVFRARQGAYIVVQAHYINTTSSPIMARAVIDMKIEPADPAHQVAAIFANTGTVNLPPGQTTTVDKYCTVFEDVTILRMNNHMHENGVAVQTEITDFFGNRVRMLKDDPVWNYEWSLNPNASVFTLAAPEMIHAGETVHTRCTYQNATSAAIAFPNEMCAFTSFVLRDEGDLICFDGLVLSGFASFL